MNIDFTLAGAVIITGLVVVFIALMGLWLLVWLFGKLFVAISSKPTQSQPKSEAPKPAAPKASASTAVKNAMVVEDGISDEIVAVIAAAVAAMGGAAGGFALRSVKRVREARSAWAAAGLMQNTQPF